MSSATLTSRGRSDGHAFRPKVLREALGGQPDDGIGGGEDRLGRPVVSLQRDDLGHGAEVSGEVENVADRRGAERIDRLRVVADDSQSAPVRLEGKQDRFLQPVRILILVDHDVIETRGDLLRDGALRHHLRPVEQQIVVIEDVLLLFGFDVCGEELPQLCFPFRAPRKELAQHLAEWRFGVDRARIDRKASALHRKALGHFREAEIMPDQIHQIGGVFAIMDREVPIEPDVGGVFAEKTRTDRVKCTRPGKRIRHEPGFRTHNLRGDALDAALHLGCGAA